MMIKIICFQEGTETIKFVDTKSSTDLVHVSLSNK
jgi:hypothetical protein